MAERGIERVCVRSVIKIGNFHVKTPYVQSFNVKKQRGQISTFDASLKVSYADMDNQNITGGCVKIYAGYSDGIVTDWAEVVLSGRSIPGVKIPIIFTGIIKTAKVTPCFDDPKYMILSISGTDVLGLLEGKKFTRRSINTISSWVAINGVTPGLKSDKLTAKQTLLFETNPGKYFQDTEVVLAPPTTTTIAPPYSSNAYNQTEIIANVKGTSD